MSGCKSCPKCDSTLLTHAHSQHFEILAYVGLETSGSWYCSMAMMLLSQIATNSAKKGGISASERYLWLRDKKLLALRSHATPCRGWSRWSCSCKCRCPFWSRGVKSMWLITFIAWLCWLVLRMFAVWFVFAIIVTLIGCAAPAIFSTRVCASWVSEVVMFGRANDIHFICWKSSEGLVVMTKITTGVYICTRREWRTTTWARAHCFGWNLVLALSTIFKAFVSTQQMRLCIQALIYVYYRGQFVPHSSAGNQALAMKKIGQNDRNSSKIAASQSCLVYKRKVPSPQVHEISSNTPQFSSDAPRYDMTVTTRAFTNDQQFSNTPGWIFYAFEISGPKPPKS